MKKSNLYTRTGDAGMTALVGGKRVAKTSVRLEAYGTVDEFNATVGVLAAEWARTMADDADTLSTLGFIQNKLFNIGGYLATDNAENPDSTCNGLGDDDTARIEAAIDGADAEVPPMRCFVLPGGTQAAAQAHVCRTVCRRCERRVLVLASEAVVDPVVTGFLNRLSDYMFALSRLANHRASVPDTPWQP